MTEPVNDDTVVRLPVSNSELIGRIATRAEDHQRFLRNTARSVRRAAAESQFRNTVSVLSAMNGKRWPEVKHGMIVAAVSDLLEVLEATEVSRTG